MDTKVLGKLFGNQQHWHGCCTVIVDGDAGVLAIGADSIGSSATKTYAPRLVSGRVVADAACYIPELSALVTLQQQKVRHGPNEETLKQSITVIDVAHVIAVEFSDTTHLGALGLNAPALRSSNSNPGTVLRPNY
jgi:hypothetical protein